MTPENIEAIKNALAPVADKIGQGAEYGWDVLVAGQFAEGVVKTGFGASLLLAAIVTLVLVCIDFKKHRNDTDFDGFGHVMIGGAILVPLAISYGLLYDGLIAVMSPEYAALKFLISLGN